MILIVQWFNPEQNHYISADDFNYAVHLTARTKNTLIQHADNVIINATQKTIPTIVPNQPLTPNTDYYNLIVDGMIDIENPEICFSIEPSRALTEYIDDDVKKCSHFYQMMQFSRFKPFLLFCTWKRRIWFSRSGSASGVRLHPENKGTPWRNYHQTIHSLEIQSANIKRELAEFWYIWA